MSLFQSKIIKRKLEPESKIEVLAAHSSSNKDASVVDIRSNLLKSENRRIDPTVTSSQLETLEHIDGLTFRIVQKYIEKIVGKGNYILEGGSEQGRKVCFEFCESIDLVFLLTRIIRDIFVTGNGNGWVELGYNVAGNNILSVRTLNPKSGIDFIRDDDGYVLYDDNLRPVGYQLGGDRGYPSMEWREKTITVNDEIVWRKPPNSNQDGRDRIGLFKLIDRGEGELGMSPLEPEYKAAIIRLNLEDTVGNAAFRSNALVAYVGEEGQDPNIVTDEQLDSVKNELLDVDEDTVWAFRRNVELDTFPSPDVSDFERLLYFFADMHASGAGVGVGLILQPTTRGYRGDVEIKRLELQDSIDLFKSILQHQIREIFFKRLLKAQGQSPKNAPKIVLLSRDEGIALSKARRISTLARYNLITPDPKLEEYLRKLEDLPSRDTEYIEDTEEE